MRVLTVGSGGIDMIVITHFGKPMTRKKGGYTIHAHYVGATVYNKM